MSASKKWLQRTLLMPAALVALAFIVFIGGGLVLAPTPPPKEFGILLNRFADHAFAQDGNAVGEPG